MDAKYALMIENLNDENRAIKKKLNESHEYSVQLAVKYRSNLEGKFGFIILFFARDIYLLF
jgi:hypothetical protein